MFGRAMTMVFSKAATTARSSAAASLLACCYCLALPAPYSTRTILGCSAAFVVPRRSVLGFAARSTSIHSTSATTAASMSVATKKVLIPIADGSEEIETACITDTLTRFGATVTVASAMPTNSNGLLVCTMSRGLKVVADCTMDEAAAKGGSSDYWDLIVLPGGMPGATHLRDCDPLIRLLKAQKESGKLYAAICASPAVVLATHGLIDADAKATCYPAPQFLAQLGSQGSSESVVTSNNLITGQGPASALDFALQLGQTMYGKEKRDTIAKEMLQL